MISDTINIPTGSRIVGQAWPEIVLNGPGFADPELPTPGIRAGRPGDAGVMEIQGLCIVTSGETDGAILLEWNVRQSLQGSAGAWDIHLGGPLNNGSSSVILHMTPGSSAYLEHISIGAAGAINTHQKLGSSGHARGALVESSGPTWLWGSRAEAGSLYQYSLFSTKDLVGGQMLLSIPDSETTTKVHPAPFWPGDPDSYTTVDRSSVRLALASDIHIYGIGALANKRIGPSILKIVESEDVSIFNVNGDSSTGQLLPGKVNLHERTGSVLSRHVQKIFSLLSLSSSTAAEQSSYILWDRDLLDKTNATGPCKSVMMAPVSCKNYTMRWRNNAEYHGSLNKALEDSICVSTCESSLVDRIQLVNRVCKDWTFDTGLAPSLPLRSIYYGWNETCSKETSSGQYCNDVIAGFTLVDEAEDMPREEMCSYCWVSRLRMMQASPLSAYAVDPTFKRSLELVNERCGLNIPTDPQPPPETQPDSPSYCLSNNFYTVAKGDNCTSIALAHSVSSADLLNNNKETAPSVNCTALPIGAHLCLPLSCKTYGFTETDTCNSIARKAGIIPEALIKYNSWINFQCDNLQGARPYLGSVVCVSPVGGQYTPPADNSTVPNTGNPPGGGTGQAPPGVGYSNTVVDPPSGATVARHTTLNCGIWHIAKAGDTCDALQSQNGMPAELMYQANPTLKRGTCDKNLVEGSAYCVSPLRDWNLVVSVKYNDLGCYEQTDKSQVVLWDYYTAARDMAPPVCAEACLLIGYMFFGLINGYRCFCGDALTTGSVKVDDAKCNVSCVGDANKFCGGSMDSTLMNVWGYPAGVKMES